MVKMGDVVIIRNYCGVLESIETDEWSFSAYATSYYTVTLRDRFDPRIKIVMEGVCIDEIPQNPVS